MLDSSLVFEEVYALEIAVSIEFVLLLKETEALCIS